MTCMHPPGEGNAPRSGLSCSAVGRAAGGVAHLLRGISTTQATNRFPRPQLWTRPILAAVRFSAAGWWVPQALESVMRDQRVNDLKTIIEVGTEAVRVP